MLTAWGLKRLDDMSREELKEALRQSHESYKAIARKNMSGNDLAPITASMDEAIAAFDSFQTPQGS